MTELKQHITVTDRILENLYRKKEVIKILEDNKIKYNFLEFDHSPLKILNPSSNYPRSNNTTPGRPSQGVMGGSVKSYPNELFTDPNLKLGLDINENPTWWNGLPPQYRGKWYWVTLMKFNFIKEIESKTEYQYHDTKLDPSLGSAIIEFRPRSNKIQGGYIYMDEILDKRGVQNILDNIDDIFTLGGKDDNYNLEVFWGTGKEGKLENILYKNGSVDYIWYTLNRPIISDSFQVCWELKFSGPNNIKNSELLTEFTMPFLRRLNSEYNINISLAGTSMQSFDPAILMGRWYLPIGSPGEENLETDIIFRFSEDFQKVEILSKFGAEKYVEIDLENLEKAWSYSGSRDLSNKRHFSVYLTID